jgi:hypothetical protein
LSKSNDFRTIEKLLLVKTENLMLGGGGIALSIGKQPGLIDFVKLFTG